MLIQRMSWAGVAVEHAGTRVLIDPLFNVNREFFGEPRGTFFPFREYGPVDAVLVTHAHSDHFDHVAIREQLGADVPVYLPDGAIKQARATGLQQVTGVEYGQSFAVGELQITAVPSVDGLGDPQVAWVIRGGEQRIIHCGDTLWHGFWWNIAREQGPFDVAFLPINGAQIQEPGMTESGEPICLTPEQAVSAARVLAAKCLVPIHFHEFHNPPIYRETPNPEARLLQQATERGVQVRVLKTKETLHF